MCIRDSHGSDLRGSNLRGSNLGEADLREIKSDFFAAMDSVPYEVEGLKSAVVEGRIDGSSYTGSCCCFVGTVANLRGCNYTEIPDLVPDSQRPTERWFLAIKPGDKPENSQVSAITLGWIDEWQKARRPSDPV